MPAVILRSWQNQGLGATFGQQGNAWRQQADWRTRAQIHIKGVSNRNIDCCFGKQSFHFWTNSANFDVFSLVRMDGLVIKTQSIPWRGVLALIGGFLIQVEIQIQIQIQIQIHNRMCYQPKICFNLIIFFIPAFTWVLLLLWQHDDIPHILHEVTFYSQDLNPFQNAHPGTTVLQT